MEGITNIFSRAVLHLDLDAFFVSVALLQNSALKGKPVLIGGRSRRGVVASCSYEARRFGVHSAMPMRMALNLCPDAIVLKGDMESYSYYSKLITDIIEEEAPLFEKSSIDEFYLDLTGMDQHIGCYKWSLELRNKIMRESGLPISFGLSINKLISKMGAGEAKPNGTKQVLPGGEKPFIHPLSIAKIPSIGKETYKKLSFMGVRTIHTLSGIPMRLLQREFGKHGKSIWEKANAIDNSAVVPYTDKKSISTERTFQVDTINVKNLASILTGMVEKLGFELRNMQRLTACISVKIRYSDFNTYSKQKRIPYTANDKTLLRYAKELFDQLYERRQLVRLVGVRLSNIVPGNYQISLFDDTTEEMNLLQTMDNIKTRFGAHAVGRASSLSANVKTLVGSSSTRAGATSKDTKRFSAFSRSRDGRR